MKPTLNDHVWATEKWSSYRGSPWYTGQNSLHEHCWDITEWSLKAGGLWIQMVFKTGFTVRPNL